MNTTPETPTPDLINIMEWNRFAEQGMTLLEALTILNNRHRAEIEAMREAIREAHAAFDELWNLSFDVPWATSEKAEASLAKLKPFLPDATPPQP